jgi:protein tyrosine phosphatase
VNMNIIFYLDDYNRVILKEIKGSDFINASYIELPNGRKKYIAAQGIGNSLINFVLIFVFLFFSTNVKHALRLFENDLREEY